MNACACGCGTSLTGARKGSIYASGACRTRAYRQRRETSRKASHSRHRAPDLRVSYRRAVAAIDDALYLERKSARTAARDALVELLTDRQRAHLNGGAV